MDDQIDWEAVAKRLSAGSGIACVANIRGAAGFHFERGISVQAMVRHSRLKLEVKVGGTEIILYRCKTREVRADTARLIAAALKIEGREE